MRLLRALLIDLTPRRAFLLFTLSGSLSLVAMYAPAGQPWLPLLPIAIYGGLLWYAQSALYRQLNGTLKDSPYFLGFTLTLVALVKAFRVLASGSIDAAGLPSFLVTEVGGAILATVTGLFLRQLLLSTDPGETGRDEVFQSIMEKLRKQSGDFATAQRNLVDLVQEFTATRETMFRREEDAFGRYVVRLERGATGLADLEAKIPEQLGMTVTALAAVERELRGAARGFAESLERARASMTEQLRSSAARVDSSSEEASHALRTAGHGVADHLVAVGRDLDEALRALRSRVAELSAIVTDIPTASQRTTQALSVFAEGVGVARSGVISLADECEKSSQRVRSHIAEFGNSVTAVTTDNRQLVREMVDWAGNLSRELKAVDSIVDQVMQLVRHRLAALTPAPALTSSADVLSHSERAFETRTAAIPPE